MTTQHLNPIDGWTETRRSMALRFEYYNPDTRLTETTKDMTIEDADQRNAALLESRAAGRWIIAEPVAA